MVLDAQNLEILVEKILVIQTAFPGDAILTLPLIQEIKKQFPGSIIEVISIPSTKNIFENSESIDNVLVFDKRKKHKSLSSVIRFALNIKKQKYTRVFSPHKSLRSSLIVLLSGIKETYGFDRAALSGIVYKHIIKYRKDFHEVKRNLSLLYGEEISDWKIKPELSLSIENKALNVKWINENEKFISIAPGSVWETKKYPIDYFVAVAKHFYEKGYKIVIIGGKEDENSEEEFLSKGIEVINFAGKLTFTESAFLLSKSEILICNDSAPTHLAMIADCKVLTLYCSTVPEFGFYPYSKKSSHLSLTDIHCKPCGIHGHKKCPEKSFDCALKLTPDKVIEKTEKMLFEEFN